MHLRAHPHLQIFLINPHGEIITEAALWSLRESKGPSRRCQVTVTCGGSGPTNTSQRSAAWATPGHKNQCEGWDTPILTIALGEIIVTENP